MADFDLEPNSSQEESTESLLARPSVARRRANQQEIENLYLTVRFFFSPSFFVFFITLTDHNDILYAVKWDKVDKLSIAFKFYMFWWRSQL